MTSLLAVIALSAVGGAFALAAWMDAQPWLQRRRRLAAEHDAIRTRRAALIVALARNEVMHRPTKRLRVKLHEATRRELELAGRGS